MIAKTTTGSNFANALGYGAADLTVQQRQRKQPQVALLASYNLISYDWQGMAAEMAAVAQGSRCQTPVWHTSLSVQPGEQLSADQWRAAARQYCTAMGADPAQHQVAIFQHHDTAHDHVHIYINRVRLDDGPALDTGHNYVRNVKTTRQIEQTLGLVNLPDQRTSLRDHSLKTQQSRLAMQSLLGQVLGERKPTTVEELAADLIERGVTLRLATNAKGTYGISFQQGDSEPVKGSAVGYKYKQVVGELATNRLAYEQEIAQLRQEKAEAEEAREKAQADREKAERAKEQAQTERDEARNQVPETIIREVIKSDPTDRQTIERLRTDLAKAEEQGDFFYEDWKDEKARADGLQREQERLRERVEIRTVVKPDPADKAEIDTLKWENTIQKKQIEDLSKRLETKTKNQVHQVVVEVAKQKLPTLAAFYQGLSSRGLVVREIDGITLEISQENAPLWPKHYKLANLTAALAKNAQPAKAVADVTEGSVVTDRPPTQHVPPIAPITSPVAPVVADPTPEQLTTAERVVWAGRRDCRSWADLLTHLTNKRLRPEIRKDKAGVDVLTLVVGRKRIDVAKLHPCFNLKELRETVDLNRTKHDPKASKGQRRS